MATPHVDTFSADANIVSADSSEIYDVANGALFTGQRPVVTMSLVTTSLGMHQKT